MWKKKKKILLYIDHQYSLGGTTKTNQSYLPPRSHKGATNNKTNQSYVLPHSHEGATNNKTTQSYVLLHSHEGATNNKTHHSYLPPRSHAGTTNNKTNQSYVLPHSHDNIYIIVTLITKQIKVMSYHIRMRSPLINIQQYCSTCPEPHSS